MERNERLKEGIKGALSKGCEGAEEIMRSIEGIYFTPSQFYAALEEVKEECSKDSSTCWD